MDNNSKKNENQAFEIDIFHIIRSVWHRAWIIVIVAILGAAIGFCYAAYFITPTYSSSIMLYVNSSSVSLGDLGSISIAQMSASQQLVQTYSVLLKNRTTMERVAQETGVPYSWAALSGMVSASSVNETEVMRITVVCTDPNMAAKIANGIAKVLPERVKEIIDATSVTVVDSAIPNYSKIAPSVRRYTVIGFLIGGFIVAAILVLFAILDNTIHDEDYITTNFNIPILAKIPDLSSRGRKYGYGYRRYGKYGYGYGKYGYGYGNAQAAKQEKPADEEKK